MANQLCQLHAGLGSSDGGLNLSVPGVGGCESLIGIHVTSVGEAQSSFASRDGGGDLRRGHTGRSRNDPYKAVQRQHVVGSTLQRPLKMLEGPQAFAAFLICLSQNGVSFWKVRIQREGLFKIASPLVRLPLRGERRAKLDENLGAGFLVGRQDERGAHLFLGGYLTAAFHQCDAVIDACPWIARPLANRRRPKRFLRSEEHTSELQS